MKKHPVDELFSRKLRDAETPPRNEAFQMFQQRLKAKERRIGWWQKGPWLAAAGVSLLLIAEGGWWLSQQPNEINTLALSNRTSTKGITPASHQTSEQKVADATTTGLASLENNAQVGSRTKSEATSSSSEKTPIKHDVKLKDAIQPLVQETQIAQVEVTTTTSEPQIKIEEPTKTVALENAATAKPTQKTVVLQLPELEKTLVAVKESQTTVAAINSSMTDNDVLNEPRKSTRMAKVWQQLKNAKNGEKVDWDEVGFNPNKLVAKAIGK